MARADWKRTIKLVLKTSVGGLVLWAVGRHVLRTWAELQSRGASIRVDPWWALISLLVYMLGLLTLGIVFGEVMRSSPSPVGMRPAIRAYVISHLGKYVPGKAMVVVIRVGLVVPYGAKQATAAFATFYETFAMMASGAILATLGFAIGSGPLQRLPLLMSLGLSVLFLVVSEPRVFPRISKLATVPFPNAGVDLLPYFSHRLLLTALLWSAAGWILLGLSQIALIRAISPEGLPVSAWPVVIASVALATVGGFAVAVLPAGVGVREGILMTTLGPSLGNNRAAIAALALRLVWVVGEILAGGLLSVLRPPRPSSTSSTVLPDSEVS